MGAGILRVAGNEIFLGSYTSRSEAAQAVKLASARSKNEKSGGTPTSPPSSNCHDGSPRASHTGKIADLFNVSIESIVSAFEEAQSTVNQTQFPARVSDGRKEQARENEWQHGFRLHDWMTGSNFSF